MGDWGGINLTRICGWLAQEVWDRTPGDTRSLIWTGRGMADNVRAVGRGEVDVAVTTPSTFAVMAMQGRGLFEGEAYPYLRALGELPHLDRLLFAVRRDLGVSSLAEMRERRMPLRLAISPNDGVSFPGYAAHRVLAASGLAPEALLEWGGAILEHERPFECLDDVAEGRADAVFHEAIMTPNWRDLAEENDLAYLPLEPEVLDAVERELSWRRAQVEQGYLRGLDGNVETLDFSGYLVLVREDMPDDVAFLLAWILGETASGFEAQFRHLPAERSPITYPINRKKLAQTAIPLHRAAAEYYQQAGSR
jgi:TRAP-type uncharacterized transport system substrate-binding protein